MKERGIQRNSTHECIPSWRKRWHGAEQQRHSPTKPVLASLLLFADSGKKGGIEKEGEGEGEGEGGLMW